METSEIRPDTEIAHEIKETVEKLNNLMKEAYLNKRISVAIISKQTDFLTPVPTQHTPYNEIFVEIIRKY
jgi:hypothetical protein